MQLCAVPSWAKTLAWELGCFGIIVNSVLPGFTKTSPYDSLMESKVSATGKLLDEIEKTVVQKYL